MQDTTSFFLPVAQHSPLCHTSAQNPSFFSDSPNYEAGAIVWKLWRFLNPWWTYSGSPLSTNLDLVGSKPVAETQQLRISRMQPKVFWVIGKLHVPSLYLRIHAGDFFLAGPSIFAEDLGVCRASWMGQPCEVAIRLDGFQWGFEWEKVWSALYYDGYLELTSSFPGLLGGYQSEGVAIFEGFAWPQWRRCTRWDFGVLLILASSGLCYTLHLTHNLAMPGFILFKLNNSCQSDGGVMSGVSGM